MVTNGKVIRSFNPMREATMIRHMGWRQVNEQEYKEVTDRIKAMKSPADPAPYISEPEPGIYVTEESDDVTEVIIYTCGVCGKKYKTEGGLTRHEESKHGDR